MPVRSGEGPNLAKIRDGAAFSEVTAPLARLGYEYGQMIYNPPFNPALGTGLGAALGVPVSSPIVPLILGGEREALAASGFLLDRGLHVPAIRPPTVPRGTSRLRVSLSAAHSDEDVGRLIEALRELGFGKGGGAGKGAGGGETGGRSRL